MAAEVFSDGVYRKTDYEQGHRHFNRLFHLFRSIFPTAQKKYISAIGYDIREKNLSIYTTKEGIPSLNLPDINVDNITTDSTIGNLVSVKINLLTHKVKIKVYYEGNRFNKILDRNVFLSGKYIGSDDVTLYSFKNNINSDSIEKNMRRMDTEELISVTLRNDGSIKSQSTYTPVKGV